MGANKIWMTGSIATFFLLFYGCYSFKGITIDPETRTYFVQPFTNEAVNAFPTLATDFTEALKDKIRNESRLIFSEMQPDIVFSGSVVRYSVTPVAPDQGETIALNRLEVGVRVVYENTLKEDGGWQQNFSFFQDFPGGQNLMDVQDELIGAINDQLVENIFNAAFNNW